MVGGGEEMIDAILFPCEMFSIKQVDICFQKEFDAATKNGNFEIIFYDYEKFAESGNLCLNKKVENTIYAMHINRFCINF